MQEAVAHQDWDSDLLTNYDSEALQEFPLETRLWRFLQTLHSDTSVRERETAKKMLQAWLDAESVNATQDSPSWLPYLDQHWAALQPMSADALNSGAIWLKDLLDRYQPLPAPLLV